VTEILFYRIVPANQNFLAAGKNPRQLFCRKYFEAKIIAIFKVLLGKLMEILLEILLVT
jgi:hypothetical protein